MEVIGRKRRGLTIGYFLCLALLVICFALLVVFTFGDYRESPMHWVILIGTFIAIIVVIVMIVKYIKFPNEPIKYDNMGAIYVNEQKINLVDILDVSYKQNRNRYATFEHGTITVQTNYQTYTAHYVDDCENVCKILTKLAYDSQNKPQE